MRRYIDYMTTRANDGIVSFGLGDWYDYGDFRAGFSRNTPVPLVATPIIIWLFAIWWRRHVCWIIGMM